MYDEMTIADLLLVAHQEAYPEDQPSAEHAPLINELVRRLRRLDVWRSNVSAEINLYLTDDDGSDLLPEPKRIRNMLERLSSAQAALVEPVVARPTDEEIIAFWSEHCAGDGDAGIIRLARYGHQPLPPAKGEVEELVAWLRETGDLIQPSYLAEHQRYKRAAAFLEQCHPAPVPVASGVYYEFVVSDADDCTQAGGIAPTYAQALSEGQHYLAQYQQDGPHTLELRRVEVLPPGALSVPQGEVQP